MTDYKTAVATVVRKTYQQHALGNRPWGINDYGCSYAAGCSIGISVSPELAREMDEGDIDSLTFLLKNHQLLQISLFGVVGEPPQAVVEQLVELQALHDTFARTDHARETPRAARDAYKHAIEKHFPNVELETTA